MTLAIKATLDSLLRWSSLQALLTYRLGRLAVLAYHWYENDVGFGRQLEYIDENLQAVSLDQVLAAIASGMPLPDRSILIISTTEIGRY